MGMSITLRDYLESFGLQYDLLQHMHTSCSAETAQVAHISSANLAKSVVVENNHECIACVVPASEYVDFSELDNVMGSHFFLATEEELAELFVDCERGAVPAAAQAYGMKVLVDERLLDCEDVYFEAGDHVALVHMTGEEFNALMATAGHAQITRHS